MSERQFRFLTFSLFFLSGSAGLIYEVTWARYLALFLGNTAHAHILVLAVFMAGLSIGNYLFGRIADRTASHLGLYGLLELCICALGYSYPWIFGLLGPTYRELVLASGDHGLLNAMAKVSLCALSFLPSTIAMGGTFPLLARLMSPSLERVSRVLGALYFFNTMGAALGAFSTGFFLIPTMGLDRTMHTASTLLLGVGGSAILLQRRMNRGSSGPGPVPRPSGERRHGPSDSKGMFYLVALLAALSGAVNMLYEVAWTRALTLFFGTSVYSFSLMLTGFLAGIALGGGLYSWISSRSGHPLTIFALAQLATGVVLSLSTPFYERLPYYYSIALGLFASKGNAFVAYQAIIFVMGLGVMIVPAMLMGVTLPAASAASARTMQSVGSSVGTVFSFNTLGTIAGTILSGLLLIPSAGLQGTFLAGTLGTLVIGLAALILCENVRRWFACALALAVGAVFVICLPGSAGKWDPRVMASGEFRRSVTRTESSFGEYRNAFTDDVLFHRDGVNTTVTILRSGSSIYLKVNGKTDASTRGDLCTQLLLGHVPALLNPQARTAAVIGFGSGMTAGALSLHPLASIDIFELSPEVIEAAGFFAPYNHDVTANPSVRVHVRDAREAFVASAKRYDIIVSEPSNPWMAGVSSLFTREFFEITRNSLTDAGLLLQWFHNYAMTDELVLMVLKTIRSVFPLVTVWASGESDILVVALKDPRYQPDFSGMEERMQLEVIRDELRSIQIHDLYGLLALQLLSPAKLDALLADVSHVNTDTMPLLEYAAPKAFFNDSSSGLLEANDEKGVSFQRGDLFLSKYVAHHPPGPDALKGMFDHQRQESSYSDDFIVSLLEAWSQMSPEATLPLEELVKRYSDKGDYGSAEIKALDLVHRYPNHLPYLRLLADVWDAYAERANSAVFVSMRPERWELLKHMAELAPEKTEPLLRLARLCEEEGRWWEAISYYLWARRSWEKETPNEPGRATEIDGHLKAAYQKAAASERAKAKVQKAD